LRTLHFVTRLMEEHGIYYFFTHEAAKRTRTVVLADHLDAHGAEKGYDKVPFLHTEGATVRPAFRAGSVAAC